VIKNILSSNIQPLIRTDVHPIGHRGFLLEKGLKVSSTFFSTLFIEETLFCQVNSTPILGKMIYA
jgi:hypothetical protein